VIPFGTVNVTGGAGAGAGVVFVGVAVVVRVGEAGFVSAAPNVGVAGVAGVAAPLAAPEPPFAAAALGVVEVGVAGLGIGFHGVTGLNSEKLLSWPGPSVATATPVVGDVVVGVPETPGVAVVVVDPPGVKVFDVPLIDLRSLGPWSAATPRKTTPRAIAMMRARFWRIWAWV
jgi:hypothetical protein